MTHLLSPEDRVFRADFEAGRVSPAEFNHRAHVRLAYVYLVDHDTDTAHRLMQAGLLGFLRVHGVDGSKYHDTLTRAWIMAVRHFMGGSRGAESSDGFIDRNPQLLDARIMMTHYSAELLFSDAARARFVEPDLGPIPEDDGPRASRLE